MDDAAWSKLFSAGSATTYKKEEVVSCSSACAAAPFQHAGAAPCLDASSS